MLRLVLLLALSQTTPRDSVVYVLSPASELQVKTGKSGLLGFAGHDHIIRARAFSGRIVYYPDSIAASHVEITVPTDSLQVLTPPDTEEIRKVTAAMRTQTLDVANYPDVRLVSRHVTGNEKRLQMTAALTIKGQTREVPLTVELEIGPDTLRAVTEFAVKQTDFGIRPIRGGPAGTVRVADRVTFTIRAVAVPLAPWLNQRIRTMPAHKDFKRLVRRRMLRTGESYTAARSKLLRKPATGMDYAKLAGITDGAIEAKTGCTWERWTKTLDYAGAYAWPHRQIAEYVHKKFKVVDWWAQTVTVGYERIKGLRAIGQRRDGTFEAAKSKTFGVPLARLYRAWSDPKLRAKWLPDDFTVRSASARKYMRIAWRDGTTVVLGFMKKGAAKAQVAVQHTKLSDRAAVTKMKAFWQERLNALGDVL